MTTPPSPDQPINMPKPGPAAAPAPGAGRPAPQSTGGKPGGAPEPHGPGVVKRTTSTVKRVLLVVIGALAALFAVFNSQDVEVDWVAAAPTQAPLILALAVMFVAGLAIGWLWAKLGGRGHDGR